MKKNHYASPRILKIVEVLLERDFLDGSVSKNTKVQTAGQEVVDHDFSDQTIFNHGWSAGTE